MWESESQLLARSPSCPPHRAGVAPGLRGSPPSAGCVRRPLPAATASLPGAEPHIPPAARHTGPLSGTAPACAWGPPGPALKLGFSPTGGTAGIWVPRDIETRAPCHPHPCPLYPQATLVASSRPCWFSASSSWQPTWPSRYACTPCPAWTSSWGPAVSFHGSGRASGLPELAWGPGAGTAALGRPPAPPGLCLLRALSAQPQFTWPRLVPVSAAPGGWAGAAQGSCHTPESSSICLWRGETGVPVAFRALPGLPPGALHPVDTVCSGHPPSQLRTGSTSARQVQMWAPWTPSPHTA